MASESPCDAVGLCEAPNTVGSLWMLVTMIIFVIVIVIIVCYGPDDLDITCMFHHNSEKQELQKGKLRLGGPPSPEIIHLGSDWTRCHLPP